MTPMQSNPTLDQMGDEVRQHLLKSAEVKQAVAEKCVADITEAASILIETLQNGGKILLCGNGGSAADCQHISAEFASILTQDFIRPALAAIALTTDTSFITAYANDTNNGELAKSVHYTVSFLKSTSDAKALAAFSKVLEVAQGNAHSWQALHY